jgi:methylated-DNA-[protein]-cysteine S-methyltransferase
MGQSVAPRTKRSKPADSNGSVEFSAFETACGWMGLVGRQGTVRHLRLGYVDPETLRNDLQELIDDDASESDWYPELREKLQAYAGGQKVSFTSVRCESSPGMTDFQRKVLDFVRRIPHGKVLSYGEVAQAAGYPGAARAVGTVMSTNRIPIIIPCHRVVAAGGKLGGYSSPRGTELKQWLLDLEQAHSPRRPR